MNNRENPLFVSFPIGTWFMTQVRVSFFFPLIVLLFCYKFGLHVGGAISAILFVSVLIHEFGHVAAARFTGGAGDEILIWPLGGLAFVQPVNTTWSRFLTAAAGPLANLILCGITLWAVLNSPYRVAALNPVLLPFGQFSNSVFAEVLVLIFAVNWALALLNLIPVYPLDGGRMLHACLAGRFGNETATEVCLRFGFVAGFALMIGGLLTNHIWVVFIGAVVLLLNMQESFQRRTSEPYDESFMGYDFSQGYTSLEQSDQSSHNREARAGFFKRWREQRRAEKLRHEQELAVEDDRKLDELLAKVHAQGIETLTDAEKQLLDRASDRYRNKGQPKEQA